MKYINITGYKNNEPYDIKVSNLVMGSGDYLKMDNYDYAKKVLDRYFELGGNTIDTARHYRHSEITLAEYLKTIDREDVVIFTKCSHPTREFPDHPRVEPKYIREDIEKSLEILGTDYADLFALHRDDVTKEVGPIVEVMNELIKEGKIRAYGVSNWERDRIEELRNYALDNDLIPLSFNSPNLSLAQCNIPRWPGCVSVGPDLLEFHKETKLPLISWSSQAGGFFSGNFAPDKLENEEMVEVYYSDDNWERYDRATELANKKGKEPIQIALSYVVNQPFPTTAVIGVENLEQLESSYAGSKVPLTDEEVQYLNLEEK